MGEAAPLLPAEWLKGSNWAVVGGRALGASDSERADRNCSIPIVARDSSSAVRGAVVLILGVAAFVGFAGDRSLYASSSDSSSSSSKWSNTSEESVGEGGEVLVFVDNGDECVGIEEAEGVADNIPDLHSVGH